ncbi:MAG: CUAEP/CCAEP-tail radical SAM (seleno)protein, partial [Bryobacteraceae bacterium]
MNVVLISTYELGRQPFGLASPAAWLRPRGHQVTSADLSRGRLPEAAVRDADVVAFYLPMHTATRLVEPVVARVRELAPAARLYAYGLYAPMNADWLRGLGVSTALGGEFEAGLVELVEGRDARAGIERLDFVV